MAVEVPMPLSSLVGVVVWLEGAEAVEGVEQLAAEAVAAGLLVLVAAVEVGADALLARAAVAEAFGRDGGGAAIELGRVA